MSALCCVAIAVSVYTEHREVESDSLIRYFSVLQKNNFNCTLYAGESCMAGCAVGGVWIKLRVQIKQTENDSEHSAVSKRQT